MSEEEVNVALCLWQFVQMLDNKPIREHWVHPINQKRDMKSFINELKLDACKFYNYCRMSVMSFEVLLSMLKDKLTKPDTNCRRSITAEERLFLTLR
jgi:endo-1,4-beta-D-glucanase Y